MFGQVNLHKPFVPLRGAITLLGKRYFVAQVQHLIGACVARQDEAQRLGLIAVLGLTPRIQLCGFTH